jgi:RecA/RadA recombinase
MGASVLAPLSRLTERETFSTGFPDIDQLLGGQGIRSGQVTAICGRPTSGVTSLTYSIMAQAQQQNRNLITFDLGDTFDPFSAMQWGVLPEQIFAVHCHEVLPSVEVVRTIVKNAPKLDFAHQTA